MNIYDKAISQHKKTKGKLYTGLKGVVSKQSLALYYSPGVGGVAEYAKHSREKMYEVTWANNLVAVVSDGSAVLGLGDIGPEGALPVMEGKAMLFKHFANIDAVPIVLDVHETEGIITAVMAIAPSFGGINLEDIAAPKCFEIEEKLKRALPIPVMHDDQHGTAIVVLAGVINSLKLLGNCHIRHTRIVIVGAGAAGIAIAKLLKLYGASDIVMVDSKGIIGPKRSDLTPEKKDILTLNTLGRDGDLKDAMTGAHIFIGVSKAGLLTPAMISSMQSRPVIFALANPEPEILPDVAKEAGAFIVATGRSDFPNQVNNSLGFPGIFRGALDNRVKRITDQHKIAAAEALAALVRTPTPEKIIPGPFDPGVVAAVSKVIR